eukprot:snap_masked-scaffold_41-processed-gene-1.23-mRNA-1 protein AED:0.26 eAED:0.26 QI:0/-1/0/1/-1/1/1/0/203
MKYPETLSPFLSKLQAITNLVDPQTGGWSKCGTRFEVRNEELFNKHIVRVLFKGSLASFIRQLHLYGFRKSRCTLSLNPQMKTIRRWHFYHPCFQRDSLELMSQIKRKKQSKYRSDTSRDTSRRNESCNNDGASATTLSLYNSLLEIRKQAEVVQNILNSFFQLYDFGNAVGTDTSKKPDGDFVLSNESIGLSEKFLFGNNFE